MSSKSCPILIWSLFSVSWLDRSLCESPKIPTVFRRRLFAITLENDRESLGGRWPSIFYSEKQCLRQRMVKNNKPRISFFGWNSPIIGRPLRITHEMFSRTLGSLELRIDSYCQPYFNRIPLSSTSSDTSSRWDPLIHQKRAGTMKASQPKGVSVFSSKLWLNTWWFHGILGCPRRDLNCKLLFYLVLVATQFPSRRWLLRSSHKSWSQEWNPSPFFRSGKMTTWTPYHSNWAGQATKYSGHHS